VRWRRRRRESWNWRKGSEQSDAVAVAVAAAVESCGKMRWPYCWVESWMRLKQKKWRERSDGCEHYAVGGGGEEGAWQSPISRGWHW